jgi:hypothetical protein
MLIEQLR